MYICSCSAIYLHFQNGLFMFRIPRFFYVYKLMPACLVFWDKIVIKINLVWMRNSSLCGDVCKKGLWTGIGFVLCVFAWKTMTFHSIKLEIDTQEELCSCTQIIEIKVCDTPLHGFSSFMSTYTRGWIFK